jgi:hypothetical protein
MPGPDPHDDTSRNYEQFEKKQLAQDCDATSVDTADIDGRTAQRLVSEPLSLRLHCWPPLDVFSRCQRLRVDSVVAVQRKQHDCRMLPRCQFDAVLH